VAQADVETSEASKKESEAEKIPEDEFAALIDRFKETLGESVTDVRASNRLSQSVARLVDPEDSLNPEMQRVYRYLGKDYEVPKKILELNPSHLILKRLLAEKEDAELQKEVIEQIYDSALLVEGLHPDPSSMAPRIQKLMEMLLSKGA
jgi:molecular chaperone HtpG